MQITKKFLIILILSLFIFSFSCKKENNDNDKNNNPPNYELIINGKEQLELGQNYKFSYTANFDVNNPYWISSNTDVASIDQEGNVETKGIGQTTITLKTDQKTVDYVLKVLDVNYTLILNGPSSILVGQSDQITYQIKPNTLDLPLFKSSDNNILTIDSSGKIQALKEGKVTITAQYKNAIEQLNIIVKEDTPIPTSIEISGNNIVYLNQPVSFIASNAANWSVSDDYYATIDENGLLKPKMMGKVTVIATSKVDKTIYDEYQIQILNNLPSALILSGENKVQIGHTISLNVKTSPQSADRSFIWQSSNEDVASIKNNKVTGLKTGKTIISVKHKDNEETLTSMEITVFENPIQEIKVEGKNDLTSGEITLLNHEVIGIEEISQLVKYESDNKKVAIVDNGYVLSLTPGTANIILTSLQDENVKASFTVNVTKYVAEKNTKNDLDYVHNIMNKMTLDEKIGQMFIGSNSGTTVTNSVINAIDNYKLGNFIFMGNNTPTGIEAGNFATALQNKYISSLKIPAFISTDQETGRVCRLVNGGTRFLGNMASAATNNSHNRYLIGQAVGEELKTYGINFDLAPVLDVNNNPDNPIINNRSFGDNPVNVALYGNEMLKGLMSSKVMACAKHFPGHGNTNIDSHYGLPMISTAKEDLYSIELAPFISAIYSGIDAIMTTHIIFSAIDTIYPATLSKKVLTDLLRNELGYTGLIITDGMQMQAITKNFGDSEAAILAVQAGADILCYTSLSGAINGINAVKDAYNKGNISLARINEAVERILLKKLKYNLFADYLPKDNYKTYDTSEHAKLNLEIAKQAVTVYKGYFMGLDKTKKTIIYSSTCSFPINNYSGTNNSFGYLASSYLKSKGMSTCDFVPISSLTQADVANRIEEASSYEQIVVAISDANSQQINFVNGLVNKRPDAIIVALNLPYDLNKYNNVNNYICLYEYTPIMAEALKLLMNSEYSPTGKCPVKLNK